MFSAGVVYKAIDLKTNKHVALKKIRVEIEDEGDHTENSVMLILLSLCMTSREGLEWHPLLNKKYSLIS